MNELAVASEIPISELASSLGASSDGVNLASYLGVQTIHHFDSPEAETRAMLTGAAVHDLGWLRRVAVRGEDRFRWLSGMVTNDVEGLVDAAGAYNLVLNAQGRIQGDCLVWRSGDGLELEWTAEQEAPLLAHLDRFIIMDDVELVPLPGWAAIGLAGPHAHGVLTALGLPVPATEMTFAAGAFDGFSVRVTRGIGPVVPRFTLWFEAAHALPMWGRLTAAGAVPAGCAALETIRIIEGLPAYGVDMVSRDLPQETSQTRALNFSKGCYLGQEIVERIRSRGQVHRHLRQLELFVEAESAEPKIGAEIRFAGDDAAKAVATLTSVATVELGGLRRIFALGMVRAEAEVGSRALVYEGGRATLLEKPPLITHVI